MRDASPWNITNYQYHPHPQCWNDSYTYITYQPHTHTHRCVVNTHTNTQLNVLITITLPPHCRCLIHSAYLRKQKKQVTTLGPKIIEHTHSHRQHTQILLTTHIGDVKLECRRAHNYSCRSKDTTKHNSIRSKIRISLWHLHATLNVNQSSCRSIHPRSHAAHQSFAVVYESTYDTINLVWTTYKPNKSETLR